MQISSSTWSAWYNVQPPGPSTLHVTGDVDVGNNFVSATLVFDSMDKSNPPHLVLRVEPQTIFIPRPDGDNIVKVHYTQITNPGSFATIRIVKDKDVIATIEKIGTAH